MVHRRCLSQANFILGGNMRSLYECSNAKARQTFTVPKDTTSTVVTLGSKHTQVSQR